MSRSTFLRSLVAVMIGASAVAAQQAPPGMPGAGAGVPAPMDGARFLLAHTGELQLTDQQVTRLAAIARRAETRRRALRATLDSARTTAERRAAPDDSARPPRPRRFGPGGPGGPPPVSEQQMQQLRDQAHTELRDALAILTDEQLAQAWEMIAMPRRGGGGPGGPPGAGRRQGRR